MKYSDETLMAYADGELDGATRAAIEAAAASDPQVAQAIARHRRLRSLLRKEFDPVLDEPLPERLLDAVNTGRAPHRRAAVMPLPVRPARADRPAARWSRPVWAAMAATLILGAFIGLSLQTTPSPLFEMRDGRLVAAGELAGGLSTVLARDARPEARIRPGLSFRTQDGEYCRSFAVGNSVGLACRETTHWRVDLLEKLPAAEVGIDRYRMAGVELPRALRDYVDERIDGDPLDAAGEAAARERGWR